jgi:hypothetical protein
MKQYLIHSVQRLMNYSKQLDAESSLYHKKWWIFNDEGDAEVLIFLPDNDVLISRSGVVTKGKWNLNANNSTLLVDFSTISYLFEPAFIDDNLFALRPLGSQNNIVVMIDEANKANFRPKTLAELNQYFDEKAQLLLDEENRILNQPKIEEARRQWEKAKEKYIKAHPKFKKSSRKRDREFAIGLLSVGVIVVAAVAAVAGGAAGFVAVIAFIVACIAFIVVFIVDSSFQKQENKLRDQLAAEYEALHPSPPLA